MTNESRLFSAPSESYLPSYESSVPSMDDLTYTLRDDSNVFHNGPTRTGRDGVLDRDDVLERQNTRANQ